MQIPKLIKISYGALGCLSVAIVAMLTCSLTYAETSTKANVSVEVKQGCNVTAKNNEHIGTISNGNYSEIGDPTEFTIACNGNNKYDIYAVGYTGDTEGNNKLVGDKDSDNKYNIITGIAQSGDISNWAFKLSEPSEGLTIVTSDDSNNNFTNYSSIPGSSTKVASRTASTLNNTKDTFKSTYAAYISKSQPADTYHGKVKYTLMDQGTTPITNYAITYDINGGDESSLPSPNPQTGSTMDSTITLSDTTPTRDGYEFVSWCSTNPGESDTCPEGSKSYEASGSYPLSDGINATLYAVWKSSEKPITELLTSVYTASTGSVKFVASDNIEVMIVADNSSVQKPYYAFPGTDVSFTGASGKVYIITVVPKAGNVLDGPVLETKSGDEATITAKGKSGSYTSMQDFNSCTEAGTNVTDVRNNISYTVAKIGNKCYMLSNLRLAAGTALNTSTSAISSNFTLPDKATSDAWTSSSQNWYGKASMKECHGVAGNGSTSTKCAENTDQNKITEYYYNWYAATANPNNPSDPTSSQSPNINDGESLGSICPKGWSLPDYRSDITEYNAGISLYLGVIRGRFMTSGYFYSGSQRDVGSYGYWWASARNSDSYANSIYYNINGGFTRSAFAKYYGASVRCMR